MNTYHCTNCNETHELEHENDIRLFDDLIKEDKLILNHFTESNHTRIIYEECCDHYFHTGLCPICGSYGDHCQGHDENEEMSINNGICPICDEYIGPHADTIINAKNEEEPSGCWCLWHGLEEWREHHKQHEYSE